MATTPTESGDKIRDAAEEAIREIKQALDVLEEGQIEAPIEPRLWARYYALAAREMRQALAQAEIVRDIIYENRRQTG